MRTTTQCPGCEAPVSVGEPVCWSCGGGLSRPPRSTSAAAPPVTVRRPVPPGPFSRTCPTCNETIALYHRTCPVCGQQGAPPTVALTPPAGWTETLLPDGAVRLERTRTGRAQNILSTLIIAGVLLLSTLGSLIDGRPRRGLLPPDAELVLGVATGVALACMGAIVAVLLAWLWAGQERWIIRNGLLEIRRECLWWKWSRGYSATDVVLEPDLVWSSWRNRSWKLLTRGHGRDQVIATSTFYGISELSRLGAYLAARTGWRWHPPQDTSLTWMFFGPRSW